MLVTVEKATQGIAQRITLRFTVRFGPAPPCP